MKKAIIFLNGEIDLDFCEKYLYHTKSSNYYNIYCTDGAYNKIKASDYIMRDLKLISGDFDSLGDIDKLDIPNNIKVMPTPDQNYTDFEKLLLLLRPNCYTHYDIFGASGNEMDHYLGILSIALKWIKKIKMRFIDKYSQYEVARDIYSKVNVIGKRVSIIPLTRMHNVFFNGLKYHINGEDLSLGRYISTRNIAVSNKICITCDSGDFVVFISH